MSSRLIHGRTVLPKEATHIICGSFSHNRQSVEAALAYVEEVIAQEVVPIINRASMLARHLLFLINIRVSLGLS